MTRPKADSDPWLTDPVTRDKHVAKIVVEGMRTIINQLRAIRDEIAESRAYREENQQLQGHIGDLEERIARLEAGREPVHTGKYRIAPYMKFEDERCSLPLGHLGNHKGSLQA